MYCGITCAAEDKDTACMGYSHMGMARQEHQHGISHVKMLWEGAARLGFKAGAVSTEDVSSVYSQELRGLLQTIGS